MNVREMVYPDYAAELFEGGDIRLRFWTPGSKFGPVHVVLISADAEELLRQLGKALDKSNDLSLACLDETT
jgi:hypothetical protein